MRYRWVAGLLCVSALVTVTAGQAPPALSGDWPQWRGADRSGRSTEKGLLRQWPASGPPVAWSISNIGGGYGSIAVKDDRVFVQGSNGRQSFVYVLNRADGKGVWSKAIG
jgi:hypothetical protein